ncbi:hypothetical protein D9M68_508980 [compost metagenome]
MTDLSSLRTALLAAVSIDGNSIGNQSFLECIRGLIRQLIDKAFWAARDVAIEEGRLAKGRGRGVAVKRVAAGPTSGSLAEEVLSRVRERLEPIYARIVESKRAAFTTAELRKTLLTPLISGQLRLPEAESLLENAL